MRNLISHSINSQSNTRFVSESQMDDVLQAAQAQVQEFFN